MKPEIKSAILKKCDRYFDGDCHVFPNASELVEQLLSIIEAQQEALEPAMSWEADDDPWKSLLESARATLTETTARLEKLGSE